MSERDIFLAALDVPDADRPRFLADKCGADADLRRRVDALFAAHAAAGDFLADPFDPGGTTATFDARTRTRSPAADPVGEAGQVIAGRYKLLERIGEGGMGSVWMAEQTEPVKRKVAVKLIKPGLDSKTVLARFEAERQALALMDHPNIAKVFDGGLDDGRPYFVMELVKGVPITQFCDARKLTPQQRLELFVPVCQAIQHAHQKGVIHRDIKPANVLVALYDDKPVPKVIDFGVAKATGPTLTEHTLNTGFGGIVGTPQYMSPEQATFNNLDIDTRSDVYSLGVLLYELLAGSPPFKANELAKRGLLEILRVVREEEPPKPSTKLSTADALPSLAANRGIEPKKLTGLLRNELDWIVMKALEKDRSRRYETANGFAADVQRYLSGEPVQAHPPTTAYRLKKFVRKNRGPVVATGAVLLTLLLGMVGTSFGLMRADAARRDAEAAAEREADERKKAMAAKVEAEAMEAEANAVVKFFQDYVFSAPRPAGNGTRGQLGSEVKLKDAIMACLPALGREFINQPLVEARLRMTLGTTFRHLHVLAKGADQDEKARTLAVIAVEQDERARALFARHRGPEHPDTLQSMHNVANSYSALNRYAEAAKLFEETLALRRQVLPPGHPDTFHSMANLSSSLLKAGRGAEALPIIDEFVATAAEPAVVPKLTAFVVSLRVQHFQKVGDPAGCRASAEMWEKLNHRDSDSLYDAACFRAVSAGVYASAGQPAEATADTDRAMALLRQAVQANPLYCLNMRNDPKLDPIRGRDDFKKLLAELEDRYLPKKEVLPPPRADK